MEKVSQSKNLALVPFIDWASVAIPGKCDKPEGEQVIVVVEDILNKEVASISSINDNMTTNNWTIEP